MRSFMEAHRMFPRAGGTVLCAVSGGRDSMCLLHRMKQLGEENNFRVAAAHFNHQLRGECADRDEAFVRDWCKQENIPFYAGRGDVRQAAQTNGWTVEEAARRLRYAFLEETAEKIGAEKIATAHQAEDQTETVLMHLVRGTGPEGLRGIPAVRGKLIRPLLQTSRREIEAYLEENGVPHVEDETNQDTTLTRNRIRHLVLPQLEEINPALGEAVERTTAILGQENDLLNGMAEAYLPQSGALDCGVLLSAHPALQPRVLRLWIDRLPVGKKDFTARHIDQMLALAREGKNGSGLDLPQGVRVVRDGEYLLPERRAPEPPPETVLLPGNNRWGKYTISRCKTTANFYEKKDTISLNCGKMNPYISVRAWQSDDRLFLPGARGSRSLKRLFADAGIKPGERDGVPVICVDGRAAAVPGIGVDRAFTQPGEEWTTLIMKDKKGE